MGELLLIALAGFTASLVDGALGMGFGPTSSTILLGAGLSPAAASTTVNLAKVATGSPRPCPTGGSATSTIAWSSDWRGPGCSAR